MNDFAKRFKKARGARPRADVARDLSQLIGVGYSSAYSQILAYEDGVWNKDKTKRKFRKPTRARCLKLAAVLKVPVEDLWGPSLKVECVCPACDSTNVQYVCMDCESTNDEE